MSSRRRYYHLDIGNKWHSFELPADDIGRGVSSKVFAISKDQAVKFYKESFLDGNRLQALRKITKMSFHYKNFVMKDFPLAWPLGPVFTVNDLDEDHFVGFVMPLIPKLHSMQDLILEEQIEGKPINAQVRARILMRIAEIIQVCHDAGFVIGDLNLRNVVVSGETLKPTLIDCDGFQFEGFSAGAGTVEFASRELLERAKQNNGNLVGTKRTKEDDAYALAVLVFETFMNGRHPFDSDKSEVLAADRKSEIVSAAFVYGANAPGSAPTVAEQQLYDSLDSGLRVLFSRTFEKHERPRPEEWIDTLDWIAQRQKMGWKAVIRWWIFAVLILGVVLLKIYAK